jgi:hypothetical protein
MPTLTSSLGTNRTAVAIAAGPASLHTCAILDNGAVSCWGINDHGQLGNGNTTDQNSPTQTLSLGTGRTAVAITSGDQHTCAILDNGAVSCWGRGSIGQLGNGNTSDQTMPTLTSSLGFGRTAVAISAGSYHTCVILDNGSVSCWGEGGDGQLGYGGPYGTFNKNSPTLTSSLGVGRTAVAISAGSVHTCVILDNNSVSCWGNGDFGKLGIGNTGDKIIPILTRSLGTGKNAIAISSGYALTCVILNTREVSCWGEYSGNYQTGNGATTNRKTPTLIDSFGTERTAAVSERDLDGDGVLNIFDEYPNDPSESVDSDGDGVGDNSDVFPNDANETIDVDGDGVGDNGDMYPNDPTESADTDGDGVGDNSDVFPNDANETIDSDGDGIGDNGDVYPNDPTESADTDGDGIGDNGDVFPSDSTETVDSDGDGVGDNSDVFPNDSTETVDSDGDGVGDNGDAYPYDPDKSIIDSDEDGISDEQDNCPGTLLQESVDWNGCSDSQLGNNNGDGTGDSGNGDELCEAGIYANLQASRTCNIPQGDMDWDGLPDEPSSGVEADEDRDGDGKMDLIELSDSIVGTDVDSMDMSVISYPDLDFVHSITATTGTNQIEIIVEYKMTMSEMMILLPLIAYTNEDGTPNDMTDFNLNSATELDRLEQQMCESPKSMLLDGAQSISHWLENFSFDGQNSPFNWECEWEERRSIDLMYDFMMISDASEIANWKETVRYTLVLDSFDATSENTEIHIPISNGTTGKVWDLKVVTMSSEQSLIYHPWIEKGTLVAPNPVVDQTSQDDTSSPAIPAVTPSYTSAWSIIVDVKEGSVDCSGYSDSVNEAGSWDDFDSMYNQNDIDYSSLSSYHEYSNSDDNIYLSCSGNVNFDQAMDGLEDDFCAYLFLYGELKQSKCDSGSSTSVILSGQKTTLQEDLDDFEQDLADLENQWQNDLDDLFDTGDSSDSSDFGAEMDDLIDTVFFPMALLILVIASISALVKKQQQLKDKRESKEENDDYESFTNQFRTQKNQSNSTFSERSNEKVWSDDTEMTWSEEPEKPTFEYVEETEGIKSPNFDFQGEVNEDGWEVCEYPRSSGVWWWKDYESQSWLIWE